MDKFADRLYMIQKQRGWTQSQLSKVIGISQGTISAYLNDQKSPTIATAQNIAMALGVSMGWLCGDAETQRSNITMDNVREKILRTAIDRYGRGAQRDKAIEELSELIRALARCDDPENVAEEMADVRIMLDQLELIFGNGQRVAAWEVMKLRRLDQRIHAADVIGEPGGCAHESER